MTLINIIVIFCVLYGLFKLTGFMLKVIGKTLGIILGMAGYLILGILAITVMGLAMFALPVIILIGIIAVISAVTK